MNALLRRLLRLPPARCAALSEPVRIPMRDGQRLAGLHWWPEGLPDAPTLVVRSPYDTTGRFAPWRATGRLLCEGGAHVVVQDVRGRYSSEGRFEPFRNEGRDGGDTLEWVAQQAWCDGRIVPMGASYEGYAAWAALGERPDLASALIVIEGTRDLYRSFWGTGAFALHTSLDWLSRVGDRSSLRPGEIDLARGLRHRPLDEADRVALRKLPTFRDWLAHPRRDAYWDALLPPLPETPPPLLSIAGWTDVFAKAQLDDYEALQQRGLAHGSRLVIGPWRHGSVSHREHRRERLWRVAHEEILAFLDRLSKPPEERGASRPVRYYVHRSAGWREADAWPPEPAEQRSLYLGESGAAGFEPPTAQSAHSAFVSDPEDPCPTLGGPVLGRAGGLRPQEALGDRSDLLVFESAPLEAPIEIVGSPQLRLYLETDAPDLDLSLRLFDVSPQGGVLGVCEGHRRLRWRSLPERETTAHFLEPGVAPVELEAWPIAWRFGRGHRIRVAIAASNFPRFDRNPQCEATPGSAMPDEHRSMHVAVWHDAARPSRVELPLLGA